MLKVTIIREVFWILVLQGTLPSDFERTSKEPMRRGVSMSYVLISMCVFPLAIAGFWAYGNQARMQQQSIKLLRLRTVFDSPD